MGSIENQTVLYERNIFVFCHLKILLWQNLNSMVVMN